MMHVCICTLCLYLYINNKTQIQLIMHVLHVLIVVSPPLKLLCGCKCKYSIKLISCLTVIPSNEVLLIYWNIFFSIKLFL